MTDLAYNPQGSAQKRKRDELLALSLLLLADVAAAAARWDRLAPRRFAGLMAATIGKGAARGAFYFDPDRLQYGIGGRGLIAPTAVRDAVDQYAGASAREFDGIATEVATGVLPIDAWQNAMEQLLRQHQAVMVGVGGGGVASTNEAELYVGSARLRFQLERVDVFAEQMAERDRQAGSIDMIQYRSRAYALAGVGTYEESRRTGARGVMTEERRFLRPADHCRTCIDQADLGWQPIGTLKPIGDSLCLWNCKCVFGFRKT